MHFFRNAFTAFSLFQDNLSDISENADCVQSNRCKLVRQLVEKRDEIAGVFGLGQLTPTLSPKTRLSAS